jgi:hypothetical protein
VIDGRLQRQHARAQEFRPGPTVHGSLESFQAADLSFCLTVRLREEITADYNDMIYADTPQEVEKRCKAFLRKWRVRHSPVADSLEEARRSPLCHTAFTNRSLSSELLT